MRDLEAREAVCGRVIVGSGTDTYDPLCELRVGHTGPCRSTAAIDQHRLDEADAQWFCAYCGAKMPGSHMLCSGSFLNRDHPPSVRPFAMLTPPEPPPAPWPVLDMNDGP